MKSKNIFKQLFVVLVNFIPITYLLLIWKTIPLAVSVNDNVQSFNSKHGLFWILFALTIVNVIVYLIMANINKVNPKGREEGKSERFDKIGTSLVIITTAIYTALAANAVNPTAGLWDIARMPLIGLLFAFIGNFLYYSKYKSTFGIHTGWAHKNPENWRVTHEVAGAMWLGGGIAIALAGLILPREMSNIFLAGATIVLILMPVSFSFLLHNNFNKNAPLNEFTPHHTNSTLR